MRETRLSGSMSEDVETEHGCLNKAQSYRKGLQPHMTTLNHRATPRLYFGPERLWLEAIF
jgi:hypothetical protein